MESLVAVLMCTYNGEKFITEQLDSLLIQTHKNIKIWVSDDGSTDSTLSIVKEYQAKFAKNQLKIINGAGKGSVFNFLSLLSRPDVKADYYAFSDQDDIWNSDKLSVALSKIKELPKTMPILYCSRTKTITEDGIEIGYSPIFSKTPCFKNALVQSIAGGNTMLMNAVAANIMKKAGPLKVISHDWWAYMLISGVGGIVIYDKYPSLLYRQHKNNQVGANNSWIARLKRFNLLLCGNFRNWNNMNVVALFKIKNLLNKENQVILEVFESARNSSMIPRIIKLWQIKVFRQTLFDNLGLMIAILLKKI